ncbi:unnamed protein product [Peronospora destructor]|uniref:Kinesin motor domain-containing protein n=1 Tax=Peronospora destructor TaxID=86335 RepID=A0AAV0UM64_9STRA|nr:unnamed protein product [Peronospora destructor]
MTDDVPPPELASQLRRSLSSLKRDVATSFRLCSRDFSALGVELVSALERGRHRERPSADALAHRRSARGLLGDETGANPRIERVLACGRRFIQEIFILSWCSMLLHVITPGGFPCWTDESQKETYTVQGSESDRGLYYRAAECIYTAVAQQQHYYDIIIDGGDSTWREWSLLEENIQSILLYRCSCTKEDFAAQARRVSRRQPDTPALTVRESQHINKSLAAVGDVLSALLAKEKHIPFRNSKLTHLLQDSLSGSANRTLQLKQHETHKRRRE